MNRLLSTILVILLAAATSITGCSSDSEGSDRLLVLVDQRIGPQATRVTTAFVEANATPELEVVTASDQEIGERLRGGEAVDIVIARRPMVDQLRAEEIVNGDALLFATDVVLIAVPPGNPANVTGLTDFTAARPTRTGIARRGSASGNAAYQVFRRARIDAAPDVEDIGPLDLVYTVARRELDAAILWRSQAASAPLSSVAIPLEYENRIDFSIAALQDSPALDRTVQWLATDPAAQELLMNAGLRDNAPVAGS